MEKIAKLTILAMIGVISAGLLLGFITGSSRPGYIIPDFNRWWLAISIVIAFIVGVVGYQFAELEMKSKTEKITTYTSDIDKKSTRNGQHDEQRDDDKIVIEGV